MYKEIQGRYRGDAEPYPYPYPTPTPTQGITVMSGYFHA